MGRSLPIPAPVGGWNARDPITGMGASDAVMLENYFPSTGDVRLRGGYADHVTGISSSPAVETLMTYSIGTTEKLFAISAGDIYDASSAGTVGSAVVSSLTNSRWEWTNITTSGGSYLHAVNGVDNLQLYDGSSWTTVTGVSSPAITGIDTSTLDNIFKHQKRLFFIEKNTLSFWYLAVDSISGAATEFNLGAVFQKGGRLVAGTTWTRDGGDGMDDLAVFITNHGEVVVYQGTDPGDADLWNLVGRYDIGAPIGKRCFVKTGGDVAVITLDGVVSLSAVLSANRAAASTVAITDKIRNAFNEAAKLYEDKFGWEGIIYPRGNYILFNIPMSENSEQEQYVMNAITGSWCKYTNFNANCWAIFGEELYFGGNDGVIYKAETGDNDDGEQIDGKLQTAFSHLGSPGIKKQFTLLRPVMITDGGVTPTIRVVVDFEDSPTSLSTVSSDIQGAIWDEEDWDDPDWGSASIQKGWQKVNGLGHNASIFFQTGTEGVSIQVKAFDLIFKPGGYI